MSTEDYVRQQIARQGGPEQVLLEAARQIRRTAELLLKPREEDSMAEKIEVEVEVNEAPEPEPEDDKPDEEDGA